MASGRHKKENYEREKPKRLEREIAQAGEMPVGGEQADQRIGVAERVKLDERETAVRQSKEERGHAQVPAVVEQRQKAAIKAANRADTKDDVQQQERGRAESANQKGFDGGIGMNQRADAGKQGQVCDRAGRDDEVVLLLLRVPTDGLVLDAHGATPSGAASTTSRRAPL